MLMDTICNKEKIIARSEGISYQQLLDSEVNPVPEALRTNTNPSIDGDMLDTARYLSREYHERELATVWKRTWQMVCRESEVTNAGDFHVYDIARYSIIVVRGEDGTLRGFHNACLHRGRTLKSGSGCTRELRCPYHGFVWNLDGSFISISMIFRCRR
jgi:nitrite reductase/ring-hydroxylating ferredoxin subunit